mmetsp:Transcript_36358/g.61272  ORF Transcript_36358/g.61272 Transcript_36358/m.61272 type:complete len:252 (+) Transcript_36358:39-794(+)
MLVLVHLLLRDLHRVGHHNPLDDLRARRRGQAAVIVEVARGMVVNSGEELRVRVERIGHGVRLAVPHKLLEERVVHGAGCLHHDADHGKVSRVHAGACLLGIHEVRLNIGELAVDGVLGRRVEVELQHLVRDALKDHAEVATPGADVVCLPCVLVHLAQVRITRADSCEGRIESGQVPGKSGVAGHYVDGGLAHGATARGACHLCPVSRSLVWAGLGDIVGPALNVHSELDDAPVEGLDGAVVGQRLVRLR